MDKNSSTDGSLTLLEIEKNSADKFRIIFDCIYERSIWGDNSVKQYNGGSGDGSYVKYNLTTYIPFLKGFIAGHQIKSVVDLGCGDFVCGPYIYSDVDLEYTGYDTYGKIIEYNRATFSASKKYTFQQLDIFNERDKIVSADLCILKDVLQHWRTADIYTFLDAIALSKRFKYIMICNCCDQEKDNVDLYVTGGFRKLSANFFPLQRYDPVILYKYHTKEISMIIC